MNEQLLKTSGADVLSSRKKTQKNLLCPRVKKKILQVPELAPKLRRLNWKLW